MVDVKVYNSSANALPRYARFGDSGMDISASEDTVIEPYETKLVKTGIYVGLPDGYELQVRPRSGLSLKTRLRVANAPGTVDSAYRGELCIIMDNLSPEPIVIARGDRIAQIVLQQVPVIVWQEVGSVAELGETGRGTQGFGSTGISQ